MNQFDKVEASFQPRREDDLVEGAREWIGVITIWQASWIIEKGKYAGEWAMMPIKDCRYSMPFAWVPSGDLKIISLC
jgi:hypothetical protein